MYVSMGILWNIVLWNIVVFGENFQMTISSTFNDNNMIVHQVTRYEETIAHLQGQLEKSEDQYKKSHLEVGEREFLLNHDVIIDCDQNSVVLKQNGARLWRRRT